MGTADRVWGDREGDRQRVDPHAALILDLEAGCLDGGGGVAGRVASAERAWPEDLVERALTESEYRPVRAHVLVEAQLTAAAQYAPKLGERVRLVRHGAEDEARDGGVERPIRGREVVGVAIDDLDSNAGVGGGGARPFAQVGLGLHGQDLRDRRGIVREVAARTRAELDHAAR